MRESESTLGRELALARAYLNVLRARMGERLEVSIDVPDALLGAEFPPMMLSTLVENAIKHGITPLRQGGVVKILAARDGASRSAWPTMARDFGGLGQRSGARHGARLAA
jgi:sensor histidine kinase YesM